MLYTSNILFIVGGAFTGLEQIVERRIGKSKIGFGAQTKRRAETGMAYSEIMREVSTDDLISFGLIPGCTVHISQHNVHVS